MLVQGLRVEIVKAIQNQLEASWQNMEERNRSAHITNQFVSEQFLDGTLSEA